MALEFKLPELGENVEAGDVVSVLVKEGEVVREGQGVLELETDKATVEVPSDTGGKILKVHVSPGQKIQVGQSILTLEPSQAAAPPPPEKEPSPAKAKTGDGAPETSSANTEKRPEATARSAPKGSPAEVVDFRRRPEPLPAVGSGKQVPASPAVRRFAREIGVDVTQVKGSGPRGRISVEDVKAYSREVRTVTPREGVGWPGIQLPDFSKFGPVERKGFNNIRRKTAQHLTAAWLTIPHVTQHDKADITELEGIRKQYAGKVEAAGGKLTITAIALKVVGAALKVFPQFNASIDVAREETIYKKYVNVGVAVDTERGLIVPVIREVDRKNITELSAELSAIAEKVRSGKVAPEELQGGCFTITNLGGIGGTSFSPIVNAPEVAILGISRASFEPVFIDGKFEPRLMMPLSLSYDHRLIDGADAARFLRWVCRAFEETFVIALEG